MKLVEYSFDYGGESIEYLLSRSERKSLAIAVFPLGEIVVKAPQKASLSKIQDKVEKRAFWIVQQRKYFAQFLPRTSARLYVGGESHYYLGRSYRLKLFAGKQNKVSLKAGTLEIHSRERIEPVEIKRRLDVWYREKAQHHFRELVDSTWIKFKNSQHEKPKLRIRKMKTRWGSLSANGTLSLNFDLIKAPKAAIEYVIIHEFCHLTYPNHDKAFFALLEVLLPQWKNTKTKMERMLS